MIDVVPPATVGDAELLVEQLLGEFDQPAETTVVAYRGRHRWLQCVDPVRLENAPVGVPLRARGVYLVTGGLGGIGLALARRLAERVSARLVLVGRSALPSREEWQSWLERSDDSDATATKIRAILALEEEAGAEVLVLSADVAEPADMARVLGEARVRFGAINGVVHAAGLLERGIMQLKTPEIAERVMRAKVTGTNVLWQLLPRDELDFVFLCSSISTVVSGPGLADYRAGNAFLDAFARSQAGGKRTRVVSVNWDSWQGLGMALALGEKDLPNGIMPHEGAELFERILTGGFTEVIVSTRDLPRLIALTAKQEEIVAKPEAPTARESAAAPESRAGLFTAFVPPATEYERIVVQIWQKLLGIEGIGSRDNFFEAGGHSLLATQLMSRLYQRFGIDVPLRTVFDAPTVATFADRVEQIVGAAGAEREEIEL